PSRRCPWPCLLRSWCYLLGFLRWPGRPGSGGVAGRVVMTPIRGESLRGSGPAPEQALGQAGPAQARIAAVPGGTVVARRAGGEVPLLVMDRVAAGGVALADQVVALLADGGGLAAGLRQPAAGVAAAAGGAASAGQQ